MEYLLTLALVFVAGYAAAWLQLGLWRLCWLWGRSED